MDFIIELLQFKCVRQFAQTNEPHDIAKQFILPLTQAPPVELCHTEILYRNFDQWFFVAQFLPTDFCHVFNSVNRAGTVAERSRALAQKSFRSGLSRVRIPARDGGRSIYNKYMLMAEDHGIIVTTMDEWDHCNNMERFAADHPPPPCLDLHSESVSTLELISRVASSVE